MAKDVKFKITAVNKTARAFKQVGKGLGNMAKKVVSLQGAIVALGAGAAIKSAIDQFSDFEQALVDVGKVSDTNIGQLREQITALPKELGSATELIQAYYQAVSSGVTDPAKALDLVTVAAKASKAAHVEQGDTIKALTKLMAGFAGEIENTTSAADLLFKIEKLGQTQFAELVPEVGKLASLSSAMNVSAEEMGGAWALITQFAGSTAQAATQYESILGSLMKPTKEMTTLLSEWGGAQAAIAELGFAGVMQEIQRSTGGVSEELGKIFGRKEAISGFLAISQNGFKTLTSNIEEMTDRAGSMDTAFANWQGTFAAVKESFMNTIGLFAIEFAEEMMPEIILAMETFSNWLEDNKFEIIGWFATVRDWIVKVAEGVNERWPDIIETFNVVKQSIEDLAPAVFRVSSVIFTFLDKLIGYFTQVETRRNALASGTFDLAAAQGPAWNPLTGSDGQGGLKGLLSNEEFFGGNSLSSGGTTINIERSVSPSEVVDITQEQSRRDSRF